MGPDLAHEIPSTTLNPCTYVNQSTSKFNFKHISAGQVAAAIRDIPSKKASGLDKIPCNVIKGVAGIISESLSIIFNKSLISGIFPDDLKSARVAPIFKSGEQSDANNLDQYLYRSQKWFINGVLSNPGIIKCSVPQGSILGPLLFLIFINDLPGCLNTKYVCR